jgi:hypothetical protein
MVAGGKEAGGGQAGLGRHIGGGPAPARGQHHLAHVIGRQQQARRAVGDVGHGLNGALVQRRRLLALLPMVRVKRIHSAR